MGIGRTLEPPAICDAFPLHHTPHRRLPRGHRRGRRGRTRLGGGGGKARNAHHRRGRNGRGGRREDTLQGDPVEGGDGAGFRHGAPGPGHHRPSGGRLPPAGRGRTQQGRADRLLSLRPFRAGPLPGGDGAHASCRRLRHDHGARRDGRRHDPDHRALPHRARGVSARRPWKARPPRRRPRRRRRSRRPRMRGR